MRQFKRSQRLAQQIHRDISALLEIELSERASGMLTFTAVRLTDDLRYAKVYYSFLGDDENRTRIEEHLSRQRRRIRSQIGKNLRIRHIPELEFLFDPSVEEGTKIERLLDEIKNEQQDK